MHDVAAVNRKSQDAGAFRKKCGKKEQNDVHARDGDVHEEDMKEVTGIDVICLYVIVFISMLQVMSALISKAQQALHDDTQPLDKLAFAFSPLPAVTASNDTFEVALRSDLNVSVAHASAAAAAAAAADTGAADSADCSLNSDDEQMMLAMACYISDSPTLLMHL
jgi:hypothetical protein